MTKGEALPARPSLEFLKKLAKQQVAALRRQGRTTSLAAAQLTLARKYGFPSWRKLKAHVELLERAAAAVEAISSGDTQTLKRLLRQNSSLANTRIDDKRTLLHVATDWPGHFPNNTETIAELVASGADVNAEFAGRHSETPLHWAASSNDVGVIDVLLDHGANIEARGSVIDSGTPMSDAVAFGQWQAARRLVGRGARTTLWQAAALGLMDRVDQYFTAVPPPTPDEITKAFWCACHGGQRAVAEYLLGRGADLNWVGYDGLTPLVKESVCSGRRKIPQVVLGQAVKGALCRPLAESGLAANRCPGCAPVVRVRTSGRTSAKPSSPTEKGKRHRFAPLRQRFPSHQLEAFLSLKHLG